MNWQPISQMPLVASMIDNSLGDTREHLETLTEARVQPHVLNDATIDRVERVHTEQMDFVDIYAQQIQRWRAEKPSASQAREMDRMEKQNQQLRSVTADVLALAAQLRKVDPATGLLINPFNYGNDSDSDEKNKAAPAFGGTPPNDSHTEPLLLTLRSDLALTAAVGTGVGFDYTNSGFRQGTGWAASNQGILVYDPSGGDIRNGSQLFGTSMKLPDGSFALDGFQALAQYDAHSDGVIDASDAVWSALKVWVDSDGIPGSGKLLSLDQAGIQSINLSDTATGVTDAAGNQILARGSFTWAAGGSGEIADVNFATNPTLSMPDTLVPVSSVIAALPDVRGYGTVTTLHQAMQLDTSNALEGLVQQFVAATTGTQRDSLVDQIIAQWAGVEGISSSSRGAFVNGQELAALEQFVGRSYTDPSTGMSDPGSQATATVVSAAYTRFHGQVYSQLMLQSTLAPLYSTVVPHFNATMGSLVWDSSSAQATLLSGLSTNRAATLTQLAEFNRTVHTLGLDTDSGYSSFRTALVSQGVDVATTFPFGTAVVQGTVGDDVITAWAGNQTIYGNGGHDTLIGGANNQTFYSGGSGGTTFIGGPGDETFIGGVHDGPTSDAYFDGVGDTFIASGGGNYLFQSAAENDTYVFEAGGRNIRIYDFGSDDILKLNGAFTKTNVYTSGATDGTDLIITDDSGGDKITILDLYGSRVHNESMTLVYGDGTRQVLMSVRRHLESIASVVIPFCGLIRMGPIDVDYREPSPLRP